MRQILLPLIGISFLVIILLQPAQASDEKNLENRINNWISSVNEGDYYNCLSYVAPLKFTGGRGLTRTVSGGEESLLFSGEKLLPIIEYQIRKMEFLNDRYESIVTIDAKVIYHNKPMHTQKRVATNGYDMMVYPATITQQWILLNGRWFIMSLFSLQYLGSS